MTDQNQLENMEYCNYLRNLVTTDATVHVRTRDVESRIDVTQATFNKKNSFHQQAGLKIREETTNILHTEHNFVLC
jgi:hypothetical protein